MFAIFLTLLLIEFVSGEDCSGCQEYECLDKNKAHCGSKEYLIEYGEKYCNRFNETDVYNRFDDGGKAFLNCVRPCLLKFIEGYIKAHEPKIDCTDLEDQAFASHVKCYLDCNFCQICKTNKLALFHAYDIVDFFSSKAIKQVYNVISKCGLFDCM